MADTDAVILAELAAASEGLLVPSEQDAPLAPFRWAGRGQLTPVQLLTRLKLPPDTPVEVNTLERFFASLTRVPDARDLEAAARAGRFAALRHLLTARLADPVLYRVGTVEVTVLLVGQSADGATLGLCTTMVET